MSRSTQHITPSAITSHFPEGGLFRLLQVIAGMLLVARLLEAPEAAVLGKTLWITQLWFAAVLIWAWDAYRRRDFRLRWGVADLAVWVVVAGHGISTGKVLRVGGDQRAALNLFWEWVGLGFSFFLLRQVLRTRRDSQRLLGVMLAAAVMLAGYGIWQHYVELPQLAGNYERIIQQLAQPPGSISPNEAARLQQELVTMDVPLNPIGRSLWENRLKSTEPFATFALANTLAGFLAGWFFVGADCRWLAKPRWRVLAKLACLLVVGYCLVLTKSRTAWVGFLVGLFAWAAIRGLDSWKFSRRWLLAGAGLVFVVFGLFAIAGLSGGFDREVISEAPKSLTYRLQYWAGAWDVVQHQPWLGTGPGNFRPHYLHYKLPESSEEIADPHNWVLDLWTSGGLPALLGFLALLAIAVRSGWRLRSTIDENPPLELRAVGLSAWELVAGLAFFLVLFVRWLSGELFEANLFLLWAGWCAAAWIFGRNSFGHLPWVGVLAGGLAVLVHLLGAGGIEMPAIVQMLLLFVVFLCGANWESLPIANAPIKSSSKTVLVVCGLAGAAFVACLMTATVPVWYRSLYVLSGDAAMSRDFNPLAAEQWYERAERADPYSPEPAERLAELAFQRWRGNFSERDFRQAIRYGQLAIERDPASNRGYRRLGLWYFQRAEKFQSTADAKLAVKYLSEATARYPHYAPLRAELALAYDRAKESQPAASEAFKALELDNINRDAGHSDKFLPPDLLKTLQDIAR